MANGALSVGRKGIERMHERGFALRPTAIARFDRAGRVGEVRAFYGVTHRPHESGFPVLRGWAGVPDAGVGFPTLKCSVESDRPGYGSVLGWIQWVTQVYPDGRATVRLVDRVPSLLDRDLPFAAAGYAPTFFDAPAYNSRPAVDWRAKLFLVTLPILSRKEPILPLAGFRWGYRIERPGAAPVPYPLERADARDWRDVRGELAQRHPAWKFGSSLVERPTQARPGLPRSSRTRLPSSGRVRRSRGRVGG